jgi:hypothetical protein
VTPGPPARDFGVPIRLGLDRRSRPTIRCRGPPLSFCEFWDGQSRVDDRSPGSRHIDCKDPASANPPQRPRHWPIRSPPYRQVRPRSPATSQPRDNDRTEPTGAVEERDSGQLHPSAALRVRPATTIFVIPGRGGPASPSRIRARGQGAAGAQAHVTRTYERPYGRAHWRRSCSPGQAIVGCQLRPKIA